MRNFMFFFLFVFSACAADTVPEAGVTGESLTLGEVAGVLRGRRVFNQETFGGNDRTCETCHTGSSLALSPGDVAHALTTDPDHPLFRPIDSDDGVGTSYTLLQRDATIRTCLDLPSNIHVLETTSPNVTPLLGGRQRLCVRRAPPSVQNSSAETQLMWDGRNADDLEAQALGAVLAHYQATRPPTARELTDVALFEGQQFSLPRVRAYVKLGIEPNLPEVLPLPGPTFAALRRGRKFFEDMPVVRPGEGVRGGICATCHSGPMLNSINEFNPFVAAGFSVPGERFTTNGSAEFNTKDERFTFVVEEPLGVPVFGGQTLVTNVPDLGRAAVTGSLCGEFIGGCFSLPGSGAAAFKIPTLWGAADSAPYFHDHSQADIDAVLQHYQAFFFVTAQTTGDERFIMTPQELSDIAAYFRYAFRNL